MLNAARHITDIARGTPRAWMGATALLWGAAEALSIVPAHLAFSDSLSWIQFFEIPVAKFYLILAFVWIEALRRLGLLPYIFFLLALGAIASSTGKDAAARHSLRLRISFVMLEMTLFSLVLWRTGNVSSFLGAIAVLAFPLLFVALRLRIKESRMDIRRANPSLAHGA